MAECLVRSGSGGPSAWDSDDDRDLAQASLSFDQAIPSPDAPLHQPSPGLPGSPTAPQGVSSSSGSDGTGETGTGQQRTTTAGLLPADAVLALVSVGMRPGDGSSAAPVSRADEPTSPPD